MVGYIKGFATQEVAVAVCTIGKNKVIYSTNIGDAASPVILLSESSSRQIGQVADFKHDLSKAAAIYNSEVVYGLWDYKEGTWLVACSDYLVDDVRKYLEEEEKKKKLEEEVKLKIHRESVLEQQDKERKYVTGFAEKIISYFGISGRVVLFGNYTDSNRAPIVGWKWCKPWYRSCPETKAMVLMVAGQDKLRYLYGDEYGNFRDITDQMR